MPTFKFTALFVLAINFSSVYSQSNDSLLCKIQIGYDHVKDGLWKIEIKPDLPILNRGNYQLTSSKYLSDTIECLYKWRGYLDFIYSESGDNREEPNSYFGISSKSAHDDAKILGSNKLLFFYKGDSTCSFIYRIYNKKVGTGLKYTIEIGGESPIITSIKVIEYFVQW